MHKPKSRRIRVYEELLEPCGSYSWQISKTERLYAYLMLLMGHLEEGYVPRSMEKHVPHNWQRLARYLYEQKVGTKPYVQLMPHAAARPRLWTTMLESRRPATKFAYSALSSGFAHTFNLEESISKAIGETLERYFLSQPLESGLICASYGELCASQQSVLDINTLPTFLPWQKRRFPEFNRATDSQLYWVRGTEYASGEETLLPAQLIFWTYRNQPDEPVLVRPTTSGCAGHFVREDAILGALLEAIQRDGFMIYWLNSLSPHVIDTSKVTDTRTRNFIDSLTESGLSPTFLDITTDIGIPTCVCVLTNKAIDEPTIAIGASAGFDEAGTLLQSATEALTVLNFTERNARHILPADYEPFSNQKMHRNERIFAWRGKEMLERFAFFVSGKSRPLSDFLKLHLPETGQNQLMYTLARLSQLGAGYEVYVYDVRDELLSKLGYHVVRAIVPALMPLYLSEYAATLDCSRLREVPIKLGYASADVYNPWPHPFP